jgi:glycosyltransferase involved in cell wall biosynthesis
MKGDGPIRIVNQGSRHTTSVIPDGDALARFAAEYEGRTSCPLVIVIAAYNEEESIGDVLRAMPREVHGLTADVLVVVDGSTDCTADVARDAGAMVCDLPVNQGQGAALRAGYRLARDRGARFIATLDADGQYDPAELPLVVTPLLDGSADFVTGSRRLGRAQGGDPVRRFGVIVFGALISLLTGKRITDPANGLRAMRVEVVSDVPLHEPQYQAAELLVGAIRRGFRVLEVPTTMSRRAAGATKKGGNLLYGLRFGRVVVSTWWRTIGRSAKTTSS